MDNPKAPFGLESFDLEALDRLMAERKCQRYLLNSKIVYYHYVLDNVYKEKVKNLVMEGEEIYSQNLCSCHNHPLTQC